LHLFPEDCPSIKCHLPLLPIQPCILFRQWLQALKCACLWWNQRMCVHITWHPYLQSNLGNMSRVLWGSFANNTHTTEARFCSAVLSQSIMSPACVTTNFGWLLLEFSIVPQFSASRPNRRVSIDHALNSRLWEHYHQLCALEQVPAFLPSHKLKNWML
jgi:hypothetical protein